MTLRPLRLLVLLSAASLLLACKAEKVEIRLEGDSVVRAAAGGTDSVRFEAVISEQFTTIDDEKRATIAALKDKILGHFPQSDVDVSIGADEYEIEIDAELIVASTPPATGAPWYVSATPATDGGGYLVQLLPSRTFGSFVEAVESINIMLGPDATQPVEFRFSAGSGMVIAGGVLVDGMPTGITRIPMTGQSVKLLFKDGVWDETSGAFLYIP